MPIPTMKNIKKKTLTQAAVLISLTFGYCFGTQTETMQIREVKNIDSSLAKLEYRVTLFQDSFFLYDPVGIELWVKNLGSDTAQVWFDPTQGWVLQDQDGKLYPSTVHIHYTGPKVIQPGDSLGGLTGLSDNGVRIPGPYPYLVLPVGQYSVYYKIGNDSTSPLAFRVVEPEGEENKALKLFLDAYFPINGEKFLQGTPQQRTEFVREHVKKLLRFVERNPKSVYAVVALPEALTATWNILHDHKLAYQINNRIMREYPESRLNGFNFLKAYYRDDPAGLRVVLDSIIRVNPHPRITAGALKTLKDVEKEKK